MSVSAPAEASTSAQAQPSGGPYTFKTPALPVKHRRVSLALPSSPRVVEGWNFRDDTGLHATAGESSASGSASPPAAGTNDKRKGRKSEPSASTTPDQEGDEKGDIAEKKPEKKPRKKWTPEETQMLVEGCNRHGVGNWKTILRDPTLKFDNRSPVDLKDRFRTYYPDAYRMHYPNAKTHLSSKVRSTLPDGRPLFEKTRSKRRRPFTEEEDKALKEGYEKYGTVWATIVKDYPIFQEQNRRSTDLRDRFRNAFPDLYSLAGYKPRNSAKKKVTGAPAAGEMPTAKRAATDDQLVTTSTGGPVRSRKRAHTTQGMLRGGTKSVPQSTACTEDEDSSGGEDEGQLSPTAIFSGPSSPVKQSMMPFDEDEDMDVMSLDPLAEALSFPDIMSNPESHTHAWSSGVSTPTHSNHWSTAAGSPTSSHLSSDMLMNASSPFMQRRSDANNNMGMIGKSAWGTDWFSPNPRLDPSSNGAVGSSSAHLDPHSPASPFSFHQLNHGVLDRYDLFPATMPSDFSSEVGVGDTHSTFSDELFQPSGFRGFTHHSSYAGDLIFGARTHQPSGPQSFLPSSAVNGGFGFGSLGLTGLSQNQGIHPMQLHGSSVLTGMDDAGGMGMGRLALDDMNGSGAGTTSADPLGVPLPPESMDEDLREDVAMGDGTQHVHQQHHMHHQRQQQQMQMSPSKRPEQEQQGHYPTIRDQAQRQDAGIDASKNSLMTEPFSLDDLVHLSNDNELHATPPATPINTAHPRPLRRSSGSILHQFPCPSATPSLPTSPHIMSLHARSLSVPPSEFRNSGGNGNAAQNTSTISALVDYNDDMLGHGHQGRTTIEFGLGLRHLGMYGHHHQQGIEQRLGLEQGSGTRTQQQQHTSSSDERVGRRGGGGIIISTGSGPSRSSTATPSAGDGHGGEVGDEGEDDLDGRPQTPTLASSRQLMSSVPSPPAITPSMSTASTASSSSSSVQSPATDDGWRHSAFPSNASSTFGNNLGSVPNDIYNLPSFLDLHYFGAGGGGAMGGAHNGGIHPSLLSGNAGGSNGDELGYGSMDGTFGAFGAAHAAQALDLAATNFWTGKPASHGQFGLAPSHQPSATPTTGGWLGQHAFEQQQRQQQQQQHMVQHQQRQQQEMMNSSIFKQSGMQATIGRSHSHHRGQSAQVAVNPQDLMMREHDSGTIRRKRASWDGRKV